MENYQLALDKILAQLPDGQTPSLLLHACCAPCSSYVLEYLSRYFAITIDYYNPNIAPRQEYLRREEECRRFTAQQPHENPVQFTAAAYEPQAFYDMARGLEQEPEGGARCHACYALRLEHAAKAAVQGGYDWFCSTLSISPHKNAQKINEIGFALEKKYGVKFLPNDFKKRGGFLRSTQLSAQYGLYRQDYCGCEFSRRKAESAAVPHDE